jgi:parallel beta-helix repeat protein
MRRKLAATMVLLVFSAFFLAFSIPIRADSRIIIVPTEYPTIAQAVSNATDGDTVYVKPGTYRGNLTIDKAIILRGEDPQTTFIDGVAGVNVITVNHSDVVIAGFTIRCTNSPTRSPSWPLTVRFADVWLLNVQGCTITGNTLRNAGCAVWLFNCTGCFVSDNLFTGNDNGIRIEDSQNNTITGNTVMNGCRGVTLVSAANNVLRSNSMAGNTQNFGVSGGNLTACVNDVDTSNTVDDKPIYYWASRAGDTVPTDAGCVVLLNCANINVQGLQLSKNQDGVLLAATWNVTVTGNNITQTGTAITAVDSMGDTFRNNTLNGDVGLNVHGNGTKILNNTITAKTVGVSANGTYQTLAENIVVATADQANILRCMGTYTNITQNQLQGRYAYATIEGSNSLFYRNVLTDAYQVVVFSDGNTVYNNSVTGIRIINGAGNTVCSNKITDGYGLSVGGHNNQFYANHVEGNLVGVEVGGSETHVYNNTIYHNNFVNNHRQVQNLAVNRANNWDRGNEGNYWSDYQGKDADGDGIGDTPYSIATQPANRRSSQTTSTPTGQDNYPLMALYHAGTVRLTLPTLTYTLTEFTMPPSTATPTQTPTTSPTPTQTPPTTCTPKMLSPTPIVIPPEKEPTPVFPTVAIYAIASAAAAGSIVSVFTVSRWRKKRATRSR